MNRKRQNKQGLTLLYKYRYITVIIIGILLFTYVGKELLASIANVQGSEEAAETEQLVTEGEVEGEQLANNDEGATGEAEDTSDINVLEEDDITDEKIEVETDEIELVMEKEDRTTPESLPALSELLDAEENINVGDDEASWTYTHIDEVDGSSKLRLTKPGNFILQNEVNGAEARTSLPIHIIIEEAADNSNIILHNINIKRPEGINSAGNYLSRGSANNAPLFIRAENTAITLDEGTVNYIDARDSNILTPMSQRSAICVYGGTANTYTLTIGGAGKLVCEDAGINTDAIGTAIGKIVVNNGNIVINVNGQYRSGIGSVAVSTRQGFGVGGIHIEIKNAHVVVNMNDIVEGEESRPVRMNGAAIGTAHQTINALSSEFIGDVIIKIGEGANVKVEVKVQNLIPNNTNNGGSAVISGAALGVGQCVWTDVTEGINVNTVLIDIVDNAVVEITQTLKAVNNNIVFFHGPGIGVGLNTSSNNVIINITSGHVKTWQTIEKEIVNDKKIEGTFRPASIGLGYTCRTFGKFTINISGGTVEIGRDFRIFVQDGISLSDEIILRNSGTGIGSASDEDSLNEPVLRKLDINLTGGDISVILRSETNNDNLEIEADGAGIGVGYEGSFNNSTITINISGDVSINVQGGYVGIGTPIDNAGTTTVVLKRDDYGNVPSLLVTARSGLAIIEKENSDISTGTTEGVMLSHFDLGENRTGAGWNNWDDNATKNMMILREVSNPETMWESFQKNEFIGNIRGVAYTLPVLEGETETRVKLEFKNEDGNEIIGYFQTKLGQTIVAGTSLASQEVVFYEESLPALWTLHDGGKSIPASSWNYTHDSDTGSGTLRLTETGFFVLRNNEIGEQFVGDVPINIIVETTADGSELIMDSMDIVRSAVVRSTLPHHSADSEAIAPFMVKAQNITIFLVGNKNKINGADTSLSTSTDGYRTALYMYARNNSSPYNLTISPNSSSGKDSLTTVNGGINALGVNGATVNMSLINGIYNLNAVSANNQHGIAFGGGYVEAENLDFSLNLRINGETDSSNVEPLSIRALGKGVAIGHNDGLGTSNFTSDGQVKLEAIAFTEGNAISAGGLTQSALAFTTTLSEADNWFSIITRPYDEKVEEPESWELLLPTNSSYLNGTAQPLAIVYSNSEIDAYRQKLNDSGEELFARMSLRIGNDDNINFLANIDGTGSTTPLIGAGEAVVSNGEMIPSGENFNFSIPSIFLHTNYLERTLSMPIEEDGGEEVRQVKNESQLPLAMSFGGYSLIEAPANITDISFAESEVDFSSGNEAGAKKLFLEFLTENGGGDVDFVSSSSQILIPRTDEGLPEVFTRVATLRGEQANTTSAINLAVKGKFTEALSKEAESKFSSTVYLRWSIQEFAEFH